MSVKIVKSHFGPRSSFVFRSLSMLVSDCCLLGCFPHCSLTPTYRQMCRHRPLWSWGGTQACPSPPHSTSRPSRPLRRHARPCTPCWTTLLPSWLPAASPSMLRLQPPESQPACLWTAPLPEKRDEPPSGGPSTAQLRRQRTTHVA